MLLFEIARVAIDALRVNKLRSLLTMLGIIIGVGAVIAMIALGNGAQQSVQDRIASLGTTLLQVNPSRVVQAGIQTTSLRRLTPDDAKAIAAKEDHIAEVQPEQDGTQQVVYMRQNASIQVVGTTPNYLDVHKYELDRGRMFTTKENVARLRVVVLGAGVAPLLNVSDPDELLGQDVRLAGEQFQVVGILKSKGQANSFGNPDEIALIPFNTGQFRVFGNNRLNSLYILAASEPEIPDAMTDIESAVRRSQKLHAGEPDDFTIRNQSDFLTTLGETTQTFTMLLAGIAAVSLLVGGIGIMNIMLVSVTERTREIGIRKALGATRGSILFQFLMEAVVLCACGGLIGVAAGMGAAAELHRIMGWRTSVNMTSIALAFGFAAATGLVFGVWPAKQAAALDPIEALRFE
ncbi:MAG TPA: ABC transporter permease [Gemmatimonadaceae bacterium]|nr:ABC transporter permease [Gemmatimonadaceae bacterium]